jgi:hypothetical protein
MSYEILLANGAVSPFQITATTYKIWKVWKIQFKDGKEVMLYKCGNEWVQRNEDELDADLLLIIGNQIDHINAAVI